MAYSISQVVANWPLGQLQCLVMGEGGAHKPNGGQGHICMMRRFAPQWLRESLAIWGQVASCLEQGPLYIFHAKQNPHSSSPMRIGILFS